MVTQMTAKTSTVRARIKPIIKARAQKVLNKLGLSISDAINLLLIQIYLKQALPFGIAIPNEKTREVLNNCEKGIGLNKCKNIDDFYDQLGI
jgi:DNA-damage-inducible protein J